jgi:2-aminoadipate transaminase
MTVKLNPVVGRLASSAIRDLLSVTQTPGMLSLAGGLPAADTFPASRIAEATGRILAQRPALGLQYGPTEGFGPLRTWVAQYERARSGRTVDPGQVVITAGSQQALDLVARTLCDRGDRVVVERPGYLGALQALTASGARLEPVPVDADGLDVEELGRRLAAGLRPVAVHLVASFQNPTGAVLSSARRAALAGLAERYGFVVIEDDPYAEIRFGGPPVPPVRAFGDRRTVTLGSFSKTVAPGLRVGWAVLPPDLVGPVVRLKQAADLQAGSLGQAVIADLVSDPVWWTEHLDRIRAVYAVRARALVTAVAGRFGNRLAVGAPSGGMFLWGRFADGTRAADLLPVALRHGVAFVPGREFFVDAPDGATLRLCFATCGPQQLAEAADRLAQAHVELLGTKDSS